MEMPLFPGSKEGQRYVVCSRRGWRSRTCATVLLARRYFHARLKLAFECFALTATGVAFLGHAPMLDGAADRADPPTRDHTHDISTADDAHQMLPAQHRHTLEAITGEKLCHLVDGCLLGDTDYATRHDVSYRLAGLTDDIGLRDNAYHPPFVVEHRGATDVIVRQEPCCILQRYLGGYGDHLVGHDVSGMHCVLLRWANDRHTAAMGHTGVVAVDDALRDIVARGGSHAASLVPRLFCGGRAMYTGQRTAETRSASQRPTCRPGRSTMYSRNGGQPMETQWMPSRDLYDAIQPPNDDRLGVLSGTAPIVRAARFVRLDGEALTALARRWAHAPWPDQAGLDALHFNDGTERTANWVLLLDALNFCFWGEPGLPRWRVEWHGQTFDGYVALAAALSRAVEEGRPLWDATYLAELAHDDLAEILRPVTGSPEIPLFGARLANAREVGCVLLARYQGQFARAHEAASSSAVSLVLLLAREFSSFADIVEWRGTRVPFLKRAQICVADLNAAFHGQQWGAFDDLEALTAFADYKLPQLLRSQGVLIYTPELAAKIDAYQPISAGSDEEIEIRAATIWAVELLRRSLNQWGIVRSASAIDYRLWAESQIHTANERPYHRTRTIYY